MSAISQSFEVTPAAIAGVTFNVGEYPGLDRSREL